MSYTIIPEKKEHDLWSVILGKYDTSFSFRVYYDHLMSRYIPYINRMNYTKDIIDRRDFSLSKLSMTHVAVSSKRLGELIKLAVKPFSLNLISDNPYYSNNVRYTVLDGSVIPKLYDDIEFGGTKIRIYDVFKIYGNEVFELARQKRIIVIIDHHTDHIYIMYSEIFEQLDELN